MTSEGKFDGISRFHYWWAPLPYKHKIIVPGNHDFLFQWEYGVASGMFHESHVLWDRGIEIEGLKIYGTPWTPTFGRWAFMKHDSLLKEHFDAIPTGLDILVTHGPPYGILDLTAGRERAGSMSLRTAIIQKKPRYHFFGHIHEGHGHRPGPPTEFYNVSICGVNNEYTSVDHQPLVLDIDARVVQ